MIKLQIRYIELLGYLVFLCIAYFLDNGALRHVLTCLKLNVGRKPKTPLHKMENYITVGTSLYSARLVEPVVIQENTSTRKVLIAELNDKKLNVGETFGITIVHQRKLQKVRIET